MQLLDIGRKGYQETFELQKKLLEDRIQDRIPDTLILVEHPPIYTVGKAMGAANAHPAVVHVPELGPVPVLTVDRGGKMTYHGPGQIVGYPIFQLTHKDIRRFLKDMEKVLAAAVASVGLTGRPCPENLELEPGQLETGLWVGDHKIGSIGIHVRHWVSYHGFALNVCPDMRYFQAIEPCGFKGDVLSSVAYEKELSNEAGLALMGPLKAELAKDFGKLSAYYGQIKAASAAASAQTASL